MASPTAFEIVTHSVAETRAVAGAVATLVEPGDALVLGGALGAGKTAFTQGFGAGLEVSDRIVSPTFTIERIYHGRLRFRHLDVYRLDHLHEAMDLGLAEALDDGDVVVIEWGEAISGVLGRDYLLIHLHFTDNDDQRRIHLEAEGPMWAGRMDALVTAIESTGAQLIDDSDGAGRFEWDDD